MFTDILRRQWLPVTLTDFNDNNQSKQETEYRCSNCTCPSALQCSETPQQTRPALIYNCAGWLGVKHQVTYLLTALSKTTETPRVYKQLGGWGAGAGRTSKLVEGPYHVPANRPYQRSSWFKQKFIRDKIKIQRIIMCSSTSYSL